MIEQKHELLGLELALGATHGLGAWSYGSYEYNMAVPDARVAAGIKAFKTELIYLGFGASIKVDLPIFGNFMRDDTIVFQRASGGLTPDGVIGPKTARHMFYTRGLRYEQANKIPRAWLRRQLTLESGNDPVAQGYVDPGDEGLGEIHMAFHPDISIEQAWSPSFVIPWAGSQLIGATTFCDGDFEGGIASYNIGWTYAKQWVEAGKPESGGPNLGTVLNPIDAYARATLYVSLVAAQPVY